MDAPSFFLARDRALRFARRIRDTRTERRLAYRDVGMTSLVNEAESTLTALLDDIRTTVADVRAGRIRDRERGYTEVPLTVAAESVADRVALAQTLDREAEAGRLPVKEARAAVLDLLDASLARLDAFVATYDAKEPVGGALAHDPGRGLTAIEAEAAWRRRAAGAAADERPATDRRAPHVLAPRDALDDLFRAIRRGLPLVAGPWRVSIDESAGLATFALGETEHDEIVEIVPSEDLVAALDVVTFRSAASVRWFGRAAPPRALLSAPGSEEHRPSGAILTVPLPIATDDALGLEDAAGPGAALGPGVEPLVAALLRAPAAGADGSLPPARLVAWMGLVSAIDKEIKRVVLGRSRSSAVRVTLGHLPREATRKAPLKPIVAESLLRAFRGLPAERTDAIVDELVAGKPSNARAQPADAAVVLALVGRTWEVAGVRMPRAIVLDPLDDADVHALVQDLLVVASSRRAMESGATLDRAAVRDAERAFFGVLGRLGRVAP